jgi:hypothetical protein
MVRAAQLRKDDTPATDKMLLDSGFLGLPHPADASQLVYPHWQFDQRIQLTVRRVNSVLAMLEPWTRLHFFQSPSPLLFELTPLEVLGIIEESVEKGEIADRLQRLEASPEGVSGAVVRAAQDYIGGTE